MDVHVPYAVTTQLRRLGVDVLTSQDDQTQRWEDPRLLDRASALGRILVSQDDDLLREAASRQRRGLPFVGVVFVLGYITLGEWTDDLQLLVETSDLEEWVSRVEYLPLK